MTKAVFFDVDFTLIYPGPIFRGEGFQQFCAKYGMQVDPATFDEAVACASSVLDEALSAAYDPELFVEYTRRIIEQMGGRGRAADACAREISHEWAACHHFLLYDEVPDVLRQLADTGIRLGLISNTHRSLIAFQTHFELVGLIAAAVSSSEHGYMKPHPSIFEAALRLVDVSAAEAVMVGDSLKHDIEGAIGIGMRGVLVRRSGDCSGVADLRAAGGNGSDQVPVIRSLRDLPPLL